MAAAFNHRPPAPAMGESYIALRGADGVTRCVGIDHSTGREFYGSSHGATHDLDYTFVYDEVEDDRVIGADSVTVKSPLSSGATGQNDSSSPRLSEPLTLQEFLDIRRDLAHRLSIAMPPVEPIQVEASAPVLHVFDAQKADDIYISYLGFKVHWWRFNRSGLVYKKISLGGLVLYLSEVSRDYTVEVGVRMRKAQLQAYCSDLEARGFESMSPQVEEGPTPGSMRMAVDDSFGNRITFWADKE
ncbi:hypothetical protein JDV02_009910 [Purpureocillium takamizusanense]|uniref:VOC domain-containing protein n=1 Tax=Purpureocillium takamizusanense TaxID=2060973 RepID=A0A9Q8VGV0_9HYPO|nr:uncharacterized protein JDV02_009910 [Purpureocillium takamizusanense]UNI24137.1 hypothetical protein JDV02_009910 [Purpureocillium takamizusanense]